MNRQKRKIKIKFFLSSILIIMLSSSLFFTHFSQVSVRAEDNNSKIEAVDQNSELNKVESNTEVKEGEESPKQETEKVDISKETFDGVDVNKDSDFLINTFIPEPRAVTTSYPTYVSNKVARIIFETHSPDPKIALYIVPKNDGTFDVSTNNSYTSSLNGMRLVLYDKFGVQKKSGNAASNANDKYNLESVFSNMDLDWRGCFSRPGLPAHIQK